MLGNACFVPVRGGMWACPATAAQAVTVLSQDGAATDSVPTWYKNGTELFCIRHLERDAEQHKTFRLVADITLQR